MDDLISRRAAIQAIDDLPNCYNGYSDTYDKAYLIGVLEELPPIEPKRGKWEHGREIARTMLGNDVLSIEYEDWHCSCCGRRYKEYVLPYNYCPNCGAKMDVPENDVGKMERSEDGQT